MAFQFLLRNPASGAAIEVEDASSRALDYQLNGVHSASVTVPLTGQTAAFIMPGRTVLEVWRTVPGFANQMVFWGEVPASAVKMTAAADTMEVVFKDPRWRWEHMYTTPFYSGGTWDAAAFVWQLVLEWNDINFWSVWPCSQGFADTGLIQVPDQLTAEKFSDRIGSLTMQVDGPDVDVSFSTGVPLIDVWNGMGAVKHDAVFRYGFGSGGAPLDSNIRDLLVSYTDPFNNIATSWTDAATGKPNGTGWDANMDAGAIYGTLQKSVTVSEAVTNDQGLFIHQGAKAALVLPRMIVEVKGLTHEAPAPFDDFYLGDTVYVTAGKGALQVNGEGLRVHGIHMDVDQEGNPQTDITVAEV